MRFKHIDGVEVTAHFSEKKGLRFRYRMEIILKDISHFGKTACVVMQNPSCAGVDVADKSVQFVEKVVFQKNLPQFVGVRRLIVVNQFARIQKKNFQGLPSEIGSKNNAAIKSALKESDIIILGWGSVNRFEERKEFVFGQIQKMTGKLLLKTKMHPARGHYNGFILAA